MAQLIFYKDGEQLLRFVIDKDETTIGRSNDNDISLPDINISRYHFVINKKQDNFILIDKSTNGTYVNGERIFSYELKNKDEVAVGTWKVHFDAEGQEDTTEEIKTVDCDPISVTKYDTLTKTLVGKKGVFTFRDQEKSAVRYDMIKPTVSIGYHKTNDIVITDNFASSFHCRIEYKNNRYFLKDLGSTNGTYVNDMPIEEEIPLPFNAEIKIGKSFIQFIAEDTSKAIKPYTGDNLEGMISESTAMKDIFALITALSRIEVPLFIYGAPGVGKETLANIVFRTSSRRLAQYIVFDCANVVKESIESELFGHEKGYFTSTQQLRKGAFEKADGGVLYLKNIIALPDDTQIKIIRVLETMKLKRLGGQEEIPLNFRLLSSASFKLFDELHKGNFKRELYELIAPLEIEIPPLKDRKKDIRNLAEHFIRESSPKLFPLETLDEKASLITKDAVKKLTEYSWPYNIRELKHVINRAIVISGGDKITEDALLFKPQKIADKTLFEFKDTQKTPQSLHEIEKMRIQAELSKNRGNILKTAQSLRLSEKMLLSKIKKYEIAP